MTRAYRGYGEPVQDAINTLDCTECGGWFPSFAVLADHVQLVHIGTRPSQKRDDTDMANLPRSTRAANSAPKQHAQAGRIPGSSREESNDYNPFLKASHIGRVGSTAKLVLTGAVRLAPSDFGDQIIAEARLGNVVYDWPIKLNSPNHRELEDTLGLNTSKWKKKIVPVEVKNHMNRDYIAVQRARAMNTAKSKKSTRKAKR